MSLSCCLFLCMLWFLPVGALAVSWLVFSFPIDGFQGFNYCCAWPYPILAPPIRRNQDWLVSYGCTTAL